MRKHVKRRGGKVKESEGKLVLDGGGCGVGRKELQIAKNNSCQIPHPPDSPSTVPQRYVCARVLCILIKFNFT